MSLFLHPGILQFLHYNYCKNMAKLLPKINKSNQLNESCKYSHACWAAWLEPISGNWIIQYQAGMTKARQKWLQMLLQQNKTIVWLAGSINSQRRRYRATGQLAALAGCKFLFLFPNATHHQLLLVGTDIMDKQFEEFWRVIAMQPPTEMNSAATPQIEALPPHPLPTSPETSFDQQPSLPSVLSQLLVFQENVREITILAQGITAITREGAPGNPDDIIRASMLKIVHRLRLLVGARYSQLGWSKIVQPTEHIPHALIKNKSPGERILLTDSDENHNQVQAPGINNLDVVHSYIATLGEAVIIDDFVTWAGLSKLPHKTSVEIKSPGSNNPTTGNISCRSIIGIPLNFDREIVGTLLIFDDRLEKTFIPQDLSLLTQLTPPIEIALGYAGLNLQLQERITAQNLAESRLVRSARLAAVGEMAAGIAHELNNPLTTVTGFVELALNEMPAGSPLHDDLDLALKEALRARGIVRGLLDFSRPSRDQRTPTDLNDLISQVLNLIRHMLRMNNLSIRLELWDDLPLVTVEPDKIQQVLHNLMQNAIRAMPSGGILTVRTALAQKKSTDSALDNHRWASILVQDTGVGIPDESLSRIFEPFFTLQTTNEPNESGVGLGLAISYGIIQSHGGCIEVESEVNKGSSFTVYLPLAEK